MGDPRKLRNKFGRPKKLWDEDRIKHDKGLKIEYGLKTMSELWRTTAELEKVRREARRLLSLEEEERKVDAKKILDKLARMGVLKSDKIDDVLSLEVKQFLERRLQTLVQRKGLARTAKQSRQLITHGYIGVKGRKLTRPGYMVSVAEEASITYAAPIDISVPTEPGEAPAAEKKVEEKPEETKAEEKKEEPAPKAA